MTSGQPWNISGKNVLITGGEIGIGKGTVIELLKRGANVTFACPNMQVAQSTADDLHSKLELREDQLKFRQLDLASNESVRNFASEFLKENYKLEVLINNAGMQGSDASKRSKDGVEFTFAVNYLGHFLLTQLLINRLVESAPSRIIAVASDAYKFCWPNGLDVEDLINPTIPTNFWTRYCRSKMAVIMFIEELHARYASKGVSTYAVHPGFSVKTALSSGHRQWDCFVRSCIHPCCGQTVAEGASTTVFCASQPNIESLSGQFFAASTRPSALWRIAKDKQKMERLWQISESFCSGTPSNQTEEKLHSSSEKL